MKHLLVVDVELNKENKHICKDDNNRCPLWNEEVNLCMYNFNNKTKGCPLKPMPESLNWKFINETTDTNSFDYGRCVGRQELIDEILGEKE